MSVDLYNRFARTLGDLLNEQDVDRIAVAVSGGGDSMALLHLMAKWSAKTGVFLQSVTVDHGLRKAAADEAALVGQVAKKLGIPHVTLEWKNWDRTGNLQSEARQARYDLIGRWAQNNDIRHVALAHTLNDQAETVLMRLARGSGVDGLSGIPARRHQDGITWIRPLLWAERQKLRDYLTGKDQVWVDDPSNDDDRFDRIKARQMLEVLKDLGLTQDRLVQTASHMARARYALEIATQDLACQIVQLRVGSVVLQHDGWAAAAPDVRDRLLAHALGWVSGQIYKPRYKSLSRLVGDIAAGQKSVLQGALIVPKKDQIWITREFQSVADLTCPTDQIWDNRWRLSGPNINGQEIRALGENGLKNCPDWRDLQLPREVLINSPAIWNNITLIAAPLAGFDNNWMANLIKNKEDFFASIISH